MQVDNKDFDDEDYSEAAIGEGVVIAIVVCTPFWLGIAALVGSVSVRAAATYVLTLIVVLASASLARRLHPGASRSSTSSIRANSQI